MSQKVLSELYELLNSNVTYARQSFQIPTSGYMYVSNDSIENSQKQYIDNFGVDIIGIKPLVFLQEYDRRDCYHCTRYYNLQYDLPSVSTAIYRFLYNLPSFLSQNPDIQSKFVELFNQIRTISVLNQLSWIDEEPVKIVDFYSTTPYNYNWAHDIAHRAQTIAYHQTQAQAIAYHQAQDSYYLAQDNFYLAQAYWAEAIAYSQFYDASTIDLFPLSTKTLQFLLKKLLDILNKKLLSKFSNTRFIRLIGKGIEGYITYTTWARPPTILERINSFLSFLIMGYPGHSYSLVTNNG